MIVRAETEADRVHGVVQPVEARVVVLPEVVLEVPGIVVQDVRRLGAEVVEQTVPRRGVITTSDVLRIVLSGAETEAVIVVVFRIVHSHAVHRPPTGPCMSRVCNEIDTVGVPRPRFSADFRHGRTAREHGAVTSVGLVLGAGGVVGGAYHAGALAALTEAAGWDARTADVVVGTAAGSLARAAPRAGLSGAGPFA